MAGLLLYCRSGFGLFNCYQEEHAELLANKLVFNKLIFARQLVCLYASD